MYFRPPSVLLLLVPFLGLLLVGRNALNVTGTEGVDAGSELGRSGHDHLRLRITRFAGGRGYLARIGYIKK
jgi:hypothetical protein